MDFDLSDELLELQEVATRFLAERLTTSEIRESLDRSPATVSSELYREIAEMGWIGIGCEEETGGGGGGLAGSVVLAEATGRALLPGPFLTCLTAATAIDRSGDDELRKRLLPNLVAGQSHVALGLDSDVVAKPGSSTTGVLNGVVNLVPDGAIADYLLISASIDGRQVMVALSSDRAGVEIEPLTRIDGQALARVALRNVYYTAADLAGDADGEWTFVDRAADIRALLLAADLLGVATGVLKMTVGYARDRIQFGRPIGTFQAISHRLADVLVDVEVARALVLGACLATDEGAAKASLLVSAAKSWTSEAAVRAAEAGVQLHGGIGFTWEHDVHLYLRRARANAVSGGTSDEHLNRIATHLDQCLLVSREQGKQGIEEEPT